MNRFIVLRESGADEFLLIDKETQRVATLPVEELSNLKPDANVSANPFQGVELATVLIPHPDVISRMYFKQNKVAA